MGSLRGQALLCRQGNPENQTIDLEGELTMTYYQPEGPDLKFNYQR
jgi:hypothetical protein